MDVVWILALLVALPLAVSALFLYLEVLFALRSDANVNKCLEAKICTAAVIVPAHNEGENLVPTLRDIQDQLGPGDRILVVADNCDDDTAEVAQTCQAKVIVRKCPDKRGKSYAVDWGVRHLGNPRPDTVIIVDADCRLGPDVLLKLKQACFASQRPVQALYVMESHSGGSEHAVGRFAWLVKNLVRPLGLRAAGMPCQLMGTGMAFPTELIERVELATGHLAEDVCLGLACARNGSPPLFLPDAVVSSTFANTYDATVSQRRRWEHGHLQLILSEAIPCLIHGIRQRKLSLVVLSLDLFVPPVTLFAFLLIVSFVLGLGTWVIGLASLPFVVNCLSLIAFTLALVTSWLFIGHRVLPFRTLALMPRYALGKVSLYSQLASKGFEKHWARTQRK